MYSSSDSDFDFAFLSMTSLSASRQQVRGFCKDKSNPEVFDDVNVYGNIYDSELHHMNFAVYTYGHQQGDWRRNRVHSNSGYGTGQTLFCFILFFLCLFFHVFVARCRCPCVVQYSIGMPYSIIPALDQPRLFHF